MAFYDMFERLCAQKGVTPTQAGRDNGIAQGVVSMWKKRGSTPKAQTIQKLADYFGVSTDDLIDDETTVVIDVGESFNTSMEGRARATTPKEIARLMEQMESLLVDAGLLEKGKDLSEKDAEFLIHTLHQIDMWFTDRNERPQEAPGSTPAPTEGKDTTSPPDAQETPSEGK